MLYYLAISDYMGPVRGLLYARCGWCVVYIDWLLLCLCLAV